MASPFPGMDPYLEEQSLWPDIHQRMVYNISEALHAQVSPQYLIRIGERLEVSYIVLNYESNVMTVEIQPDSLVTESYLDTPFLDIPVADKPQVIEFTKEERQAPYLEIICGETGDVVTLIEVLSPPNKIADGHEEYIQKQNELLKSESNLVEIDLLSYGRHTTLTRCYEILNPADWRYMITLSRVHWRRNLQFYAIPLHQRLPRCRIPLREDEPDAGLDLPAIFTRCYEAGGYGDLIDYSKDPSVSLSEAEQAWMNTLLVNAGLR